MHDPNPTFTSTSPSDHRMLDSDILGLAWQDEVQSEAHAGADFYGALNMAAF